MDGDPTRSDHRPLDPRSPARRRSKTDLPRRPERFRPIRRLRSPPTSDNRNRESERIPAGAIADDETEGSDMTYVVTENCIKCKYTDCVEVCPVDCFYEGENMLVIHPDECIDCGVCEPECPAEADRKSTRLNSSH